MIGIKKQLSSLSWLLRNVWMRNDYLYLRVCPLDCPFVPYYGNFAAIPFPVLLKNRQRILWMVTTLHTESTVHTYPAWILHSTKLVPNDFIVQNSLDDCCTVQENLTEDCILHEDCTAQKTPMKTTLCKNNQWTQCKNIPDEDCTAQEYLGWRLHSARISRIKTAQ